MATPVAKALIDEYVTEIKERINDDKKRIWAEQGFSLFGTANRILGLAVRSFSVLGFFLLIVLAGNLSEADIQGLMNAPASEIKSGISLVLTIFASFWFLNLCLTVGFYYHNYFRDMKQERLDREQARLEEIRLITAVCEELLTRHKLINQEGVDNG